MSGEQLRVKRVLARIPGYMVSRRAGLSRGRLSEIECGHVALPTDELAKIDRVINELIEAKEKLAKVAAEAGWPMSAL